MAHVSPTPDSSRKTIVGFFRGLFRAMLCLCVWSGPTPMLHAHEKTGDVIGRDADLAEHVRTCHSHDECEHGEHWHLHLVLWDEVQPDSSGDGSLPQRPQLKHLQSEFAIAPSDASVIARLASLEALNWDNSLADPFSGLYSMTFETDSVDRASLLPYQTRVAASHDAALLSMVARC